MAGESNLVILHCVLIRCSMTIFVKIELHI